jgi:hypothetical protein
LRLAGPAALECRKVFEDRWLDHPGTPALDRKLGASAAATVNERRALAFPPPKTLDLRGLPSGTFISGSKREARRVRVAIGRTFGNLKKSGGSAEYRFAPNGEYTAWARIEQGILWKSWISSPLRHCWSEHAVARKLRSA